MSELATTAQRRRARHAPSSAPERATLDILNAANLRSLQQSSGNQAVQRLLAQRQGHGSARQGGGGSRTTTITEDAPLHLTLRLRGQDSTKQTASAPEPDPDPGGGGSSTVTEDAGPPLPAASPAPVNAPSGGAGIKLGGQDAITFNGKSYQFMVMKLSRLRRLLEQMDGSADAKRQTGAFAAAHRRLRQLQANEKPKAQEPTGPSRKQEQAAASSLKHQIRMLHWVSMGVPDTTDFMTLFTPTAHSVDEAIESETCLAKTPQLNQQFVQLRSLYMAHLKTLPCIMMPAAGGALTIINACDGIEGVLKQGGIPNAKNHMQAVKQMRPKVLNFSKLSIKPSFTVLDLRQKCGVLVLELQTLARDVTTDLNKKAGQKQGTQQLAVNWNQYHTLCDAHSQYVLDANPSIYVTVASSLAALRKARDVIQAIQGGMQYAVACSAFANSNTFSAGKGKSTDAGGMSQRSHIRLTQGGTQIRMEAQITTRYVIDKDIRFVEFLQVNYGHAGGAQDGTLQDHTSKL